MDSKEITPKGALDELCDLATPNGDCLNYVIGLSGIILQALDRLEILDKLVTDDCIAGNQVGLDIINNLIERANKYKEKAKQLEKENQELRNKLNINFEDCADELCEALTQRDKLYDENLELQKENQELKEEIQDLKDNETIVADYGIVLWNENEKSKKVIDILKNKKVDLVILLSSNDFREYNANITIRINGVTYLKGNNYTLTQQEYDLLKEMLENV